MMNIYQELLLDHYRYSRNRGSLLSSDNFVDFSPKNVLILTEFDLRLYSFLGQLRFNIC